MKLLYGAVSLLLAPLYLLTACWSAPQDSRGEIARQTGLDLSGGEEISCYDTHSGNGDGVSCIVWQFPDDQVLEQVEQDRREEILQAAEILIKYGGYIERERELADKQTRLEYVRIPDGFDYGKVTAISTESRQKLSRIRPATIGQASRIPGVSPADVNVLLILLGR